MFKKITIVAVLAALIAAFFYFDLNTYLTLEGLKGSIDDFRQWRDASPVLVLGGFFLIYVTVTALSLPGAAILTLTAGALFGLVEGLLLASFASSLGALLAFLVSRYILRDTIKRKFPDRLASIDKGIEREGAFYLFTLRLVPLFPFFLINLLMGLTAIKSWTFYWVSQIGMLAGTFVYVNAGTQLSQLESLQGILSFDLILSFVLLGIFPLIAKTIISVIKKQRVYKGWKKPKHFDRNLIVIGAGAGGFIFDGAERDLAFHVGQREKIALIRLNDVLVETRSRLRSKFVTRIDVFRWGTHTSHIRCGTIQHSVGTGSVI